MRLLDQVSQSTSFMVQQPDIGVIRLPGPEMHAAGVRAAAPKFVLMSDVARACGDIVYGQSKLLRDCCDLVRIPATALWAEWFRGETRPAADRGSPGQKAGILVATDEEGRAGTLRSFWEDPAHGVVCAPALARFDLDRQVGFAIPHVTGIRPLDEILSTIEVECDPEWVRYYRLVARDGDAGRRAIEDARRALLLDYLMLVSLSLLLSMPHELGHNPTDFARLNAARARAGKPALLDHDEISMSLFPAARSPIAASSLRGSARLHHVRGHLVRRHDAVFWRRPHMRGSADLGYAPQRPVRVYLGASPPSFGA